MKLIVGLGNPGEKYRNNRHNAGFMVIDALAAKVTSNEFLKLEKLNSILVVVGKILILAKPQTMMNNSGEAVKKILEHYDMKYPDLWVIHDDLDIALGSYKIQRGKGPKLHRGISSIEEELGKGDFWRVRVGVENRTPNDRVPGEDYVLQDFSKEEFTILTPLVDRMVRELKLRISSF